MKLSRDALSALAAVDENAACGVVVDEPQPVDAVLPMVSAETYRKERA